MTVIVVLSTGRCGTQFLSQLFENPGQKNVIIEHEALKSLYQPRSILDGVHYQELINQNQIIGDHLDKIDEHKNNDRIYIETGWPIFAWAPFLRSRYQGKIKFIHVTRHPIRFAISLKSHGFFDIYLRDDGYTKHCQIDPFLRGVTHPEYAKLWGRMNHLEKCLYQWLEINIFIEKYLNSVPECEKLRIKSEQVFSDLNARHKLLEFCNLSTKTRENDATIVDEHRNYTSPSIKLPILEKDANLLGMSNNLGYNFYDYDTTDIDNRFRHQEPKTKRRLRISKQIKSRIRRIL